ncbi:hypothetical protein SDRG_15153 [Saprolegnia diclina VS20]|uniref:RAP domain-containing protein n=1 Tax=Saprolegnia diclina (strain VS20) TaxID=1156394 RepID=T0PNR1_SAPDV|nr:hypothetical protein SDRG_15153 [Saprolegnia diclina VS20]EQC27039.1 hypothetical protein SDRG_15153 [Saprolegnia diclina VS20]|eukprot:XP_008619539.1 hypothetical protein SDRG_15153 [Saprolegnia diclina VS20]
MLLRRSLSTQRRSLLGSEYPKPTKSTAKLVCGKCENVLVATHDLFFLNWLKGVHVASFQNIALENVKTAAHPRSPKEPWKHAKLRCCACDQDVATRANVRGQEATLFSAKNVSFQLPLGSSPIVSMSGLPSDLIRFSSWGDLLAQLTASPKLRSVLNIRQDHDTTQSAAKKDPTSDFKEFNTKLLLAESGAEVLSLMEAQHPRSLNHVNVLTAFQRFAMFHIQTHREIFAMKRKRMGAMASMPSSDSDDDDTLIALERSKYQRLHLDTMLIYSTRFWTFVDELERHVQMHLHLVPSRFLHGLMKSLIGLQLAPSGVMASLAQQVLYRLDQDRITPERLVHLLHGFASLCAADRSAQAWLPELFTRVSDYVLAQTDPVLTPELLGMLAWSCAVAQVPHVGVATQLLETARTHKSPSMAFATQVYQVHLENWPGTPRLPDATLETFKAKLMQQQRTNISSHLHRQISTTLERMQIQHANEHVLSQGYSLDIALVDAKIGIEVNGPMHYQLRRNPTEQWLMGSTLLKMRHIQLEGWTVIQVSHLDFTKLPTPKQREDYLSLLLEVATASRERPPSPA